MSGPSREALALDASLKALRAALGTDREDRARLEHAALVALVRSKAGRS